MLQDSWVWKIALHKNMPSLIGPWIESGDTTIVDTAKKHELGTRAFDANGNEYIYLTGVANTVSGYWVTFDELHITTLTVADAKGRVAIAMAATVASTYGWYLIYGTRTTVYASSPITNNAQLYLSSSPGMVDDADVAGDSIIGAWARSALATAGTALLTVELSYPIVTDTAID